MTDIIIRGGLVCTGENPVWEKTDIAVSDDKIEYVGNIEHQENICEIDARGLHVSPGFVDIHGHSDFRIFENPKAESKIRQGITTEVSGNCGFSAAPAYEKCAIHLSKLYPHVNISWKSFAEYAKKVKATAINIAPLVGAGTIRGSVVGYKNKPATDKNLKQMGRLLKESLEVGAFGLSSGLSYPTGIYASKEEINYLARIVAEYDGFYATHMRSEGDALLESIEESINVAKETGVSLQISHLKARGKNNFHKIDQALRLIEEARADGIDVWCDRYPFTALSCDLDSVLPSWVYDGGNKLELLRLKDKDTSLKIKEELRILCKGDESFWERIFIAKAAKYSKNVVGKSIAQLAVTADCSCEDIVIGLLITNELCVEMLSFEMSEDNMNKLFEQDFVFTGSDSSIITKYNDNIHPRNFLSFPAGMALADKKSNCLAEFVCQNTGKVAKRIGLDKRGFIKEGFFADIVVFDKDKIVNKDYDVRKVLKPNIDTGVIHVMVNGEEVLSSSRLTGTLSGRLLRK